MQRAQTGNHFVATQADYFPLRKTILENSQRRFIVGVVKDRHEYDFIGDVKIGVTRGQARAFIRDRRRTRQGDDFEFRPVLIRGALQPLIIVLQKP